jgi:hypothetical protein
MGTSRIDEIWTRSSCLHLDNRSTHEENLEFHNLRVFLDLLQELDSNLCELWLWFAENLIDQWNWCMIKTLMGKIREFVTRVLHPHTTNNLKIHNLGSLPHCGQTLHPQVLPSNNNNSHRNLHQHSHLTPPPPLSAINTFTQPNYTHYPQTPNSYHPKFPTTINTTHNQTGLGPQTHGQRIIHSTTKPHHLPISLRISRTNNGP